MSETNLCIDLTRALTRAYILMLKIPGTNELRFKNQATQGAVVKALADAIGVTQEELQNMFERGE